MNIAEELNMNLSNAERYISQARYGTVVIDMPTISEATLLRDQLQQIAPVNYCILQDQSRIIINPS